MRYPTALLTARDRYLWWSVFIAGLCWSLLMAWRSQIGGDQRMMLELGWQIIADGQWPAYGMPTSAGGRSPGGFMAILMALPLYLWRDYRSPAMFLVVMHTGAFLILAHCLKPNLSRWGQWLLLLLVWLNPWRMYFATHIWNANLMFVAAVLHLASTRKLAQSPTVVHSAAHVVLIALAMQIHTSAALLAILSLLLFWKGLIRVQWHGIAVGVALSVVAYLPWVIAISNDPSLTPGNKGFVMRGLLYVFPLVRGVLYSLQMSSLSLTGRVLDFDFTPLLGASINKLLAPVGMALGVIAHLTLLISGWVQWRFIRRYSHAFLSLRPWTTSSPLSRSWLRGYLLCAIAAALVCFAISPTTVMFWQAFIILPTMVLVLIMASEALLLTKAKAKVLLLSHVWFALSIALLIFQGLAAPLYRCGGRDPGELDYRLIALHVSNGC